MEGGEMNHEIHEAHEKAETLAEIVAQIRAAAYIQNADTPQSVLRLANRIEAAWKRERAEIEADALSVGGVVEAARKREMSKIASKNGADFGQLGDAAALREALVGLIDGICFHCDLSGDCKGAPCEKMQKAKAALAAPPRNCDVGTAEEQAERYGRYCDKFTRDGMHCETCPCCGKIPFGKCEFAWGQIPYEEGGAS